MLKMYDIDVYWTDRPELKSGFSLFGESEAEVIEEALSMSANFPLNNGTHEELPPPDIARVVKTYS